MINDQIRNFAKRLWADYDAVNVKALYRTCLKNQSPPLTKARRSHRES